MMIWACSLSSSEVGAQLHEGKRGAGREEWLS